MAPPKIPAPSKIDALPFPVFGLAWYGTPSAISTTAGGNTNTDGKKNPGISALAYCGGGGSSKTGVFNKIITMLAVDGGEGERRIEIDTGEALCFGISLFRPHDDDSGMVRLLACVGDEVLLYGIPIAGGADSFDGMAAEGEEKDEAILLGTVNVGQGYGANVTAFSEIFRNGKLLHCVAVGCENGTVMLYELHREQQSQVGAVNKVQFVETAVCRGHTKAVCAIHFHPRGSEVLSSAKDGSARIFSSETGMQIGVMECEVHYPNGPPPKKPPSEAQQKTKDPRMMKKAPQILVRGCAYGDLEGRTIYTVASGKRGAAYLSKWKTLVPLSSGPSPGGAPKALSIRQEYRIQCSTVPISATSLSSDGTLLSLGSVDGAIMLYNLETKKVLKSFQGHDLPVTCLASRPIPSVLMLPGEMEGGVNYDAVSASADNRLGRWTLQRKSRIQPQKQPRSKRKAGALESLLWNIMRVPILIFVFLLMVAIHDVFDLCHEEVGLSALMMDMNAARHCIYREVLWAESTRAGVRSVPE